MATQDVIDTTQPSRGWGWFFKRLLIRAIGGIIALAAILWLISKHNDWEAFQSDLRTYHGATIGQTKIELQYALGAPQTVMGPYVKDKNGWNTASPLLVNATEKNDDIPEGYNPMPQGKSVVDYDNWHYWSQISDFDVEFDEKSRRLENVSCYSAKPSGCDSLFGIGLGTDDKEVLRLLGKPDKDETTGGEMFMGTPVQIARTLDYDALGLRIVLVKRAVTALAKRAPQDIGFWWMTHGRL